MNTINLDWANLNPEVFKKIGKRVEADFHRFAEQGLPHPLEPYLLEHYQLDVSTTYGGIALKNPWGKASGQLSMTAQQVEEDAVAGLGFCVLKTVIARDATGGQSMVAWAIPEARMRLERIAGQNGQTGWTVSWRGRGWFKTFEDYLQLVREARRTALPHRMLIVPSCKYFLPTPDRPGWDTGEYHYTTREILKAYDQVDGPGSGGPMPLEKDFSPTLAGSSLAADQHQILDWLRQVPGFIRQAAEPSRLRVGLKLFNALFDDPFQLEMLKAVAGPGADRPDFVVYANRLFDPQREFDGQRGIAYGGPDLSARNLRILAQFAEWRRANPAAPELEISATGDISSGRKAAQYMLLGCRTFQLHTYFQLPASEYAMRRDNKIARALHQLYFHPRDGFILWARHAAVARGCDLDRPVRILDLIRQPRPEAAPH